MANGDAAAAAGYTTVPGSEDWRLGYDRINRALDDLTTKVGPKAGPIPVAKGGTGGATPAAAAAALAVVPTSDVVLSDGSATIAGKIPRYAPDGGLIAGYPTKTNSVATKQYVDSVAGGGSYLPLAGGTISGNLTVNGHIRIPNATPVTSGYVSAYINSDGRIGETASSRRFKKNIRHTPGALFAGVLKLTPRLFNWKKEFGDDTQDHVGLIAEEVAEHVPWLVLEDDDGPRVVHYELLALALLPVVQQQQATIDELLERVAHLEARP